jgi:hypothetical protein
MIKVILKLAKILKHVFKYLPLYLILWGFLKKLGKDLMKSFTSGRNDAKPASEPPSLPIGIMPLNHRLNENNANEKPVFKLPQEIRGVSLKPEERAFLETGKALFIADMNGIDGEKFSSYVKMDKEIGKLEFYRENPDMPRQIINQTGGQYKMSDQKQTNAKKFKI